MRRIREDFPVPADADEVARLVAEACDVERVQAAIVLAAAGELDALIDALELASGDWRDLLVVTGLADTDWPRQLDERLGRQARPMALRRRWFRH